MARLLSLLSVFLLGVLILDLAPPARGEGGRGGGEGPRLVIDREEHSFGAAAQEQELETTFTIQNVGTARAEGIQPVGDCGCYGVKISKNALDPGEEATLTLKFRTLRYSGHHKKRLKVFTANAPDHPLTVHLHVDVIAGVVIEPERVFFGDVLMGKRPSQTIDAKWNTSAGQPFEVTHVDVPGHDFDIGVAPIEDGNWRGTSITLTFKEPPPLGLFSAQALIRTTHPDYPRISLPLTANITGRVWVQSRVVYFGWVKAGAAKTTSILVRPFDADGDLGEVTASSRDGRVQVEVTSKPGDPPAWRRLRITAPATAAPGRLDDVILLRTAVVGEEITEIHVRGEVLGRGR